MAGLAAGGCGRSEEPQTIPTETFVATYVDLRMATLRSGLDELPPAQRDEILARHGVSEEDLLRFADVWGRDPTLMHPIWDTVEARIDAQRQALVVDSAGS